MHPGQMIKEDFLADYGLTQYALAKALKIVQSRLTEIIKGRRGITAETAAPDAAQTCCPARPSPPPPRQTSDATPPR